MKLFVILFLFNGFLGDEVVHKQQAFNEKGPDYQIRFERIKLSHHQKESMGDQYGFKFMLDTTKYLTPLPETQTRPDVTFDGTNYFAVWQDLDGYNELRGARVDTGGKVLDNGGIWLTDLYHVGSGYVATNPGISFGDSLYLAAFGDIRYEDFDVFGVRIKQDGTVLDPNGFTVISKQNNQGSVRVSSDGTNFLIVYSDFDYNNNHEEVWGVRVSPDGTVLDPGGFPIHSPQVGWNAKQPDVAFDGINYMAVWKRGSDATLPYVYGGRVGTDGVVIDTGGFSISAWETSWGWPSITFGGTNYFVVWRDTTNDIVGTRITTQGQVIDVPPINISPTPLQNTEEPKVSFDGQNYVVFWSDIYAEILYLTRVDLDGNVLDPEPIQVANIGDQGFYRNVCSGITNSLIVWAQSDDIYGSRVDTSGNVLDPDGFPVSISFNYQEFPALTFDNQNYFSVWSEFRDGLWNIYGIRTDTAGNRIDTNAFAVSPKDWTQYWNDVAFLDSIYLTVWHAQPSTWDVHGARVTKSGEVLDPYGIAIGAWSGDQGYPSVTSGDSNFITVWDDTRSDDGDIYGAIITPDGQNLNPTGIPISTIQYAQWYPDIAFDGINYFAVWEDQRTPATWGRVYGARISQDGTVLEPAGILINDNYSTIPKIAFSNNQYLAVWMDIRTVDNYDIYGSRIKSDGTVLDPDGFPICTDAADQAYPDVTFDGEKYIVLWEDYRDGNPDIYASFIDTSGNIDTTMTIAQTGFNEFLPALTTGPSNQVFFNYTGWSSGYNASRIYGSYYPETGVKEDINKKGKKISVNISPNPFQTSFNISYSLPNESNVSMKLYDVSGRLVEYIVNGIKSAGTHTINQNLDISSGIYFLSLKTDNDDSCYKLIKIKK